MKHKPIVFLGIIGALYAGSSVAIQSENPRVQRLAVMGLGASILAGAASVASLTEEHDDYDDDPRMKDVYDEIKASRRNEDPEPEDIDLEDDSPLSELDDDSTLMDKPDDTSSKEEFWMLGPRHKLFRSDDYTPYEFRGHDYR